MPNAKPKVITDRALIAAMIHALQQDEARRAGVAERDIERTLWTRWRIARAGGVTVVVQGLGRMRPLEEP